MCASEHLRGPNNRLPSRLRCYDGCSMHRHASFALDDHVPQMWRQILQQHCCIHLKATDTWSLEALSVKLNVYAKCHQAPASGSDVNF